MIPLRREFVLDRINYLIRWIYNERDNKPHVHPIWLAELKQVEDVIKKTTDETDVMIILSFYEVGLLDIKFGTEFKGNYKQRLKKFLED